MTAPARGLRILSIALLSLVMFGGCENLSTQEGVGAGLGGVIGGVIGHQIGGGSGRTVATVLGAGLGAWIGKEIGARLTPEDQQAMDATLDGASDGQSRYWRNADTGNAYTMTPQRTYLDGNRECRDFDLEVVVDGERRTTNGTACRRPDDQAWTRVQEA